MTETQAGDLTAVEAVRTLKEIDGYEERLTARTVGLTFMVWAFAVAGIPLSYAAAVPWVLEAGRGFVLLNFLWVPWVAAAITVTATLWSGHSVSLGERPRPGRDWLWGVGFTLLFFVIAGGAFLFVGFQADTWVIMGIATGLFTLLVATVNHVVHRSGRLMVPLYAAGAIIATIGILLHVQGVEGVAAGLATGFANGFLYFAAGGVLVARG